MRFRFLGYLLLSMAALTTAVPLTAHASAKTPVWEVVETKEAQLSSSDDEAVEVETKKGAIYITASRPVEVRVYTILGQLITHKTVPAGTTRLTLGLRGVYILKAETITRRINL